MDTIRSRLQQVQHRISVAERLYGRKTGSVTLLAISKGKSVDEIKAAYDAGQRRFGESYIQEALTKIQPLSSHDIEWHFIGPIQSNKTRHIARYFRWVHSVDRVKIAKRLNDQRPPTAPPLNICLQINISNEATKAGVDYDDLAMLAQEIKSFERLRLRGLMAIPAPAENIQQQRHMYMKVRQAQQELIAAGWKLDTLSMGMSGDMEAAIAEGATIVRIGTAIFGERDL